MNQFISSIGSFFKRAFSPAPAVSAAEKPSIEHDWIPDHPPVGHPTSAPVDIDTVHKKRGGRPRGAKSKPKAAPATRKYRPLKSKFGYGKSLDGCAANDTVMFVCEDKDEAICLQRVVIAYMRMHHPLKAFEANIVRSKRLHVTIKG